jgi:hypothetical protein
MTKSTRSTSTGLDLRILAALAAIVPGFTAAPFALGLTSAEDKTTTDPETDEEKNKKAEDEKKKEDEAKAKGSRPPLSACLSGALAALKGGTPALAAAALTTEQQAHAATKATLTQAQTDLTTARASLASSESALATVCAFFGIKSADVLGLSAEKVNGVLQAKISASAIEIVAGIGIDSAKAPATTNADTAADDPKELHKQFQAIKDPAARAAFYLQHKATLFGA